MKRSPIRRKTPIVRRLPSKPRKRTAYAARERDTERMLWVKTLRCAVNQFSMPWCHTLTPCSPVIEADHMGKRGVGRKADDDTCGPLCTQHHLERTGHSGVFRYATKDELRVWMDGIIELTQAMWTIEKFRRNGLRA